MARTHDAHLPPVDRAKRGKQRQKARTRQAIGNKSPKQTRSNERAALRKEHL